MPWKTITRQELYDEVWSQPVCKIAPKYNLSHKNETQVTITVEADITGYGDWRTYRSFSVPVGEMVTHHFPSDFNAYWVRTSSNTAIIATAQLLYK